MNRWLILVLIVIGCILLKNFIKPTKVDINDNFEKSWSAGHLNKDFVKIGQALVKNHISVCGEYYTKESKETQGEYLLACTADGKNFEYFLVWVKIGDALHVKDEGFTKPY